MCKMSWLQMRMSCRCTTNDNLLTISLGSNGWCMTYFNRQVWHQTLSSTFYIKMYNLRWCSGCPTPNVWSVTVKLAVIAVLVFLKVSWLRRPYWIVLLFAYKKAKQAKIFIKGFHVCLKQLQSQRGLKKKRQSNSGIRSVGGWNKLALGVWTRFYLHFMIQAERRVCKCVCWACESFTVPTKMKPITEKEQSWNRSEALCLPAARLSESMLMSYRVTQNVLKVWESTAFMLIAWSFSCSWLQVFFFLWVWLFWFSWNNLLTGGRSGDWARKSLWVEKVALMMSSLSWAR